MVAGVGVERVDPVWYFRCVFFEDEDVVADDGPSADGRTAGE